MNAKLIDDLIENRNRFDNYQTPKLSKLKQEYNENPEFGFELRSISKYVNLIVEPFGIDPNSYGARLANFVAYHLGWKRSEDIADFINDNEEKFEVKFSAPNLPKTACFHQMRRFEDFDAVYLFFYDRSLQKTYGFRLSYEELIKELTIHTKNFTKNRTHGNTDLWNLDINWLEKTKYGKPTKGAETKLRFIENYSINDEWLANLQ